jgi:YtkA-like
MATGEQVASAPTVRPRRFGRRAAILVIAAIIGVLALGWLADALGQFAPRTTFTNGETRQAGLYQVALTITPAPARTGQSVMVTARVEDVDGHPAMGLAARLTMTMPTMEMATVETPLALNADGIYEALVTLAMAGEWRVRVELTPPGAAAVRADFDVPVR